MDSQELKESYKQISGHWKGIIDAVTKYGEEPQHGLEV